LGRKNDSEGKESPRRDEKTTMKKDGRGEGGRVLNRENCVREPAKSLSNWDLLEYWGLKRTKV